MGFTYLVPAHLGSPGKRAVKRVCVTAIIIPRRDKCLETRLVAGTVIIMKTRRQNVLLEDDFCCALGEDTEAVAVGRVSYDGRHGLAD